MILRVRLCVGGKTESCGENRRVKGFIQMNDGKKYLIRAFAAVNILFLIKMPDYSFPLEDSWGPFN